MTTFMRFSVSKFSNVINRKIFAFLGAMLILMGGIRAQNNVSYDVNSIPIGGNDNTAIGFQSQAASASGSGRNTSVGSQSLFSNVVGRRNTAIGNSSLFGNISASYNTAVGDSSMYSGITTAFSNYNTAIGARSMNLSTGFTSHSTAIGYNALINAAPSISIFNATAIGSNSIANFSNSIQLGDANVTQIFGGVGTASKFISGGLQITGGTPTTGYVLTSDAVGNATWQPSGGGGGGGTSWDILGNYGMTSSNYVGTHDAAPLNFGVNDFNAGKIDMTLKNAFFGFDAGTSNSTGIQNTAVGDGALSLSDVADNTAVGYNAMYNNKNGIENTAIGSEALKGNLTGNQNTAVGRESLLSNTTGDFNTATGYQSLYSNMSGQQNTAFGFSALKSNTSGSENTAVGYGSLQSSMSGDFNTATGGYALAYNSGIKNTAHGYQALYYNNAGSLNTALGISALENNLTGNSNTAVGSYADVATDPLNNAAAIGAFAIVNTSDKIRLGDVNVTLVETATAYSPSDGRFKNNITESDVKGLEFINKLRPVVYNFDTKKFESFLTQKMPDSIRKIYLDRDFSKSTAIRQSGFIAQEVEKAAKEVGYDFNGLHVPESKDDNYSLAYAQFTVPLVKAVQELSRQNDSLRNEIAEIKAMIIAGGANKNITGSISIAAGEGAKLFQNAPNPFSKTTTIRYTLPDNAKKAMISITNISGVRLKEFDLKSKSGQSIEINGGQLAAGTYIYSLYVDDNLIDSRQMILTR